MFIISLHYTKPTEIIEQFLPEHRLFLDKYFTTGTFICAGRKVPRTGGIILAVAAEKSALEAIIQEDPFWQNNIANYEITEFEPTKSAPALTPLL